MLSFRFVLCFFSLLIWFWYFCSPYAFYPIIDKVKLEMDFIWGKGSASNRNVSNLSNTRLMESTKNHIKSISTSIYPISRSYLFLCVIIRRGEKSFFVVFAFRLNCFDWIDMEMFLLGICAHFMRQNRFCRFHGNYLVSSQHTHMCKQNLIYRWLGTSIGMGRWQWMEWRAVDVTALISWMLSSA